MLSNFSFLNGFFNFFFIKVNDIEFKIKQIKREINRQGSQEDFILKRFFILEREVIPENKIPIAKNKAKIRVIKISYLKYFLTIFFLTIY